MRAHNIVLTTADSQLTDFPKSRRWEEREREIPSLHGHDSGVTHLSLSYLVTVSDLSESYVKDKQAKLLFDMNII